MTFPWSDYHPRGLPCDFMSITEEVKDANDIPDIIHQVGPHLEISGPSTDSGSYVKHLREQTMQIDPCLISTERVQNKVRKKFGGSQVSK